MILKPWPEYQPCDHHSFRNGAESSILHKWYSRDYSNDRPVNIRRIFGVKDISLSFLIFFTSAGVKLKTKETSKKKQKSEKIELARLWNTR